MSAILTFLTPPLGLDQMTEAELLPVDGAEGLYTLSCESAEGPRFFVIDAAIHLPTYQPVITESQSRTLGLMSPDEASVLVIVNPQADPTTVNLRAPIVMNTITGNCAQLIMEDQEWPVRVPLTEAR